MVRLGDFYAMNKLILKEYDIAVFNQINGDKELMEDFKNKFPNEYKLISAMYRKRVAIKETLNAMQYLNEPIYWFTLTFNNNKDKNTVIWKRKEAQQFLNKIAPVYLMVEEYGEDNGRYHIHGFLCFRYGYGFKDFTKWHSRQKLEELREDKFKKKTRYLTKYATKQVPQLRRSKQCSILYNEYKYRKRLENNFKDVMNDKMQNIANTIDFF